MEEDEKPLWEHTDDEIPPAGNMSAPSPTSLDIERVNIAEITGPLVILYGPSEVGKTVTLLRLCSYVSPGYSVEVDRNFRNDPAYARAVDTFDRQRREDVLAPDATANINFLLVNVTLRGANYCQILEAPGEHFFPPGAGSTVQHPHYLNRIFQSSYRKIYVFFFERSLIGDRQRFTAYTGAILNTLRRHANVKRDRVIIVFNKSDERLDLYRNGRPAASEFRNSLYSNKGFGALAEFLKASRFRRVHFVPFSSGDFGEDSQGLKTYAMSEDHYPKDLWRAIHDCVKGGFTLFR